ncbi:hypothetical protein LCGC14_2936030 [marine sediment metagenome]|uniref:Uncharacterized protein n=1 Tax=marine sediment metagenome TaxID=412755 RepID=A0A0F8XJY2_9ZZZZ
MNDVKVEVYRSHPGVLTVNVKLQRWTSQDFTTLPQNEVLKSKIANTIGLAVSEFLHKSSERGG